MAGMTNIVFYSGNNEPTHFVQENFKVQRMWTSPHTLPNIVHGQVFHIFNNLTTQQLRELPLSIKWGRTEQCCWFEHWKTRKVQKASTPSNVGYTIQFTSTTKLSETYQKLLEIQFASNFIILSDCLLYIFKLFLHH